MKIRVSGILRKYTDYRDELDYPDADTIHSGVSALVAECPDLRKVLLDGNGNVRRVHLLFLNGEQIDNEQLAHAVGKDDALSIVTAIAGG